MRTFGGKYRPLLELGRGGMSRVFLCIAESSLGASKLVVVKTLLPEFSSDSEFLSMFLEEARLSARLNHPNVIQIQEISADDGEYFIVMEFLDGQSLEGITRKTKTTNALPVDLHLWAIAEAAKGLHYAHEITDNDGNPLRLVHRDISPHNVFVTYQGEVKVLDFGIAKAADSSQQTRTGVLKGKFGYMAPEQLKNPKGIDRRADVFALGVMLWQAATYRRLWSGMSDIDIFQRLAANDIPSPLTYAPGLAPELTGIIMRALAPAREDRYPTAGHLAEDLENYLEATGARVGARELGTLTTDLFEDRRAKVKKIVDAALAAPPVSSGEVMVLSEVGGPMSRTGTGTDALRAAQRRGEISSTPSPMSIGNSGGFPASDGFPASGGFTASGALPAPTSGWGPPGPLRASGTNPGLRDAAASPSGRPPSSTAATSSGSASITHRTGGGNRNVLLASAAMIAVAVAAGLALVGDRLGAEPTGAPQPPPSVALPTTPPTHPTAPAEPAFVELSIAAQPREARLFLDNVELAANPTKARFGRDGRKHVVRAEAPGYQTSEQTVEFDEAAKSVNIVLGRPLRR